MTNSVKSSNHRRSPSPFIGGTDISERDLAFCVLAGIVFGVVLNYTLFAGL